jgi:hypothetical protein
MSKAKVVFLLVSALLLILRLMPHLLLPPLLKAPLLLLLQWMALSLLLPLPPQSLVWLRMCSLVLRSQIQV